MTVLALRAPGLLGAVSAAGILSAADVHVAVRLGALTAETDERVLLALALTVRTTRLDSVVLDLATVAETVTPESEDPLAGPVEIDWPELDGWVAACAASPLTRPGEGGAPLHLVGSRLWLDRYWQQEAGVAEELLSRTADRPDDLDTDILRAALDRLFPEPADADQRAATEIAALARVSVIAGGPGTGKTTTVARLIAVLWEQHPQLRVALAAPTAKAAQRVQEAVRAASGVGGALSPRLAELSASTLHRLLGWKGSANRFRHHRGNRLPYDVVIVDESSMVSLTMMARLIEALAPATRLVLVGDPDQLASVEAGAVLGDLVEDGAGPLQASVAQLREVRRFAAGGPIAALARLVQTGAADEALAMLRAQPPGLVFHETPDDEPVEGAALTALQEQVAQELAIVAAARRGDAAAALRELDRRRLLCAHRAGPRGVREWSDRIERWLAAADPLLVPRLDGRYAGQPLRVTVNDYENRLWNSDTGVVIERDGVLLAAFGRDGEVETFPLVRLSDIEAIHAATVHNAQGSQFEQVTVLLPFAESPLATRQTFYTAITRASGSVQVIGSAEAVLACVSRRAARATGLRDRLRGTLA